MKNFGTCGKWKAPSAASTANCRSVELARLIQKELGKSISQSYLSQIESGARPHLTNSTRMLLARFFKVHPGYLVDDPEGLSERADLAIWARWKTSSICG